MSSGGAWIETIERALKELPSLVRLETLEVADVWGADFHTTPSHELIHVLQGHAKIQFRNRAFSVGPGDTFVIPQGTPHRDIRSDGPAYRVMYTFFRWPSGQALLEELTPSAAAAPGARTHLQLLMRQLESEFMHESESAAERMQMILVEVMLALARHSRGTAAVPPASRRSLSVQRRKELAESVHAHIAAHCAESLSLEALAKQFDVSPFHLCRTYTQVFGVSMTDTLARLRVERACAELKAGASVKEAAARCGFTDPNYFAKVFRKVTGVSPSQHLLSLRKRTPRKTSL